MGFIFGRCGLITDVFVLKCIANKGRSLHVGCAIFHGFQLRVMPGVCGCYLAGAGDVSKMSTLEIIGIDVEF